MEREKGKLGAKRGPNKTKATLFPSGDFIALGSKSSRNDGSDLPSKASSVSKPSPGSSERKREGTSPSSSSSVSGIPPKKIKLSSPLARSSSSSGSSASATSSVQVPIIKKEISKTSDWDVIAVDVEPSELLAKVLDAEERRDDERQEALLCGAVKLLRGIRSGAKQDPILSLSLMVLAKTRKALFISDTIIQAFCSLLKREVTVGFKGKTNTLMVSVLASNVLLAAFHEITNWPEEFVKVYVEDSLGERVWVDSDECKGFVDNILTAFGTVLPPKSMMAPELNFKPDVCPSPPAMANLIEDDDASSSSMTLEAREHFQNISVVPRYKNSRDSIEQYVMETIREQLARRQPMEVSRNMLRLLISTCGLSEVRNLVAQKLEMWLQNPKLTRPAQDLLSAICLNCSQHTQQDVEVISQLIRVRMKTKPIISHFLQCMKELLRQHPENLSTVLKHAIYNELSTARNPNNMQLLGVIFQHAPEKAAKGLAEVFFELLTNRDDYLRALRALLREIVRTVRHDLHYTSFSLGLLMDRRDSVFKEFDAALKERILLSVIDLIVLTIFLAISPNVREAASSYNRTEKKDLSVLRNYQNQVTIMQRDAVWWLHTVVPKMFKPGRNEFIHCLHKVLFMEQIEHYYNKDNWPPDGDRHFVLKLASEVPVLDDTLMRILIIGFSRDHPTSAPDALELADQLVKRAASIYDEDFVVLRIEKEQIFEAVFNLCAYHHPENITLPSGYKPPNLAIADLYWKAWIMLLIIVAHNPANFGLEAWEQYPTLRYFMEMCITNHFSYPPPTVASGEKADEIRAHEMQIVQLEKQAILEFESHLAAASTKVTITEGNSLLLSKLITMDPLVIARKPPGPVLEQVKSLNQTLKLGHLLCRSRRPDFLLDIIQRQGTSQSMPWLAELVESSEGSFSMLPVQCLCEFLLNETATQGETSDEDVKSSDKHQAKKRLKQKQLLQHLQLLLHNPEAVSSCVDGLDESQATKEVLDYFLRRLSSQQTSARALAMKGLNLLLLPGNKSPMSEDEDSVEEDSSKDFSWLLKAVPALPHFQAVLGVASCALRQACQVENDPFAICAYVKFLSLHACSGNLQSISDLALDMAQLIVERPTIVNCIVPPPPDPASSRSTFLVAVANIFVRYLRSARIPSRDYSWSEAQDHILVHWATGESATMHILVVHAMVTLLTYGPPNGDQSVFTELLETWFPSSYDPPQAYLVDTSEEALLLPDWLKLRMIRSSMDTLVNAALKELEPSQLVLFVQSFGIPVTNMSKLLMCLDLAVEVDSCSVEQSIVDKSYMAQLVEVQHQRGAQGGLRFARLLGDVRDPNQPANGITEVTPIPAPVIQRVPPRFSHPLSPTAVYATLIQIFDVQMPGFQKSSLSDTETFQSLHKAISLEILKNANQPFIEAFIGSCEQILKSAEGPDFIAALHKKPVFASALFRLIISAMVKVKDLKQGLFIKLQSITLTVCMSLECSSVSLKSPLRSLLRQFLSKHGMPHLGLNQDPSWKRTLHEMGAGNRPFTINNIMEVIQLAEAEDSCRLEEATQQLVAESIRCHQVPNLLQALTTLVVSVVLAPASGNSSSTHTAKYRLFVDWIARLEPEVMGLVPEIQQRLLFCKRQKGHICNGSSSLPSFDGPVAFRPYFLALLTHQAGWETLRRCIKLALEPHVRTEFDPSSVLDFLWACIHIPKIWQGKDKHIPKHYEGEDVLALKEYQVISVIDFIVRESVEACTHLEKPTQDVNPVIATRLPLLIRCCRRHRPLVTAVVNYLLNFASDREISARHAEVAQQLLLQLYLQVPSVMLEVMVEQQTTLLNQAQTAKLSYSKLDTLSHTLLISLSTTDSSKQCTERMSDLNLACRKLVSAHPLLMLRQLPMMAALLRGRVNLEFSVFRSRNHLTFFSHLLGLLELLAPYIFLSEYGQDLAKTLNCYLEFFQANGCQNPELSPLLNRFLLFVQSCLAVNPGHIRPCLQQHINTLHDLSQAYPDLAVLKSLLAGSSWLSHSASSNVQASSSASGSDGSGQLQCPVETHKTQEEPPSVTLELWSSLQKPSGWTQSQLTPMAARLNQEGNAEDVLSVLQDLENISNRKPNILDYFVDEIKSLIQNHNRSCRQAAFNLMIKHMKNKPGSAREFVSAYLQCLEHEEQDIILTALQRLPEMVILAQEYGSLLLQKAFAVGISTNINSAPQICETMLLLNVQSGS